MHKAKLLAIMAAAGCLSLVGAGCKSGQKADHPSREHPNAEHPQGEHPQGEHPQGAHREDEHPDG